MKLRLVTTLAGCETGPDNPYAFPYFCPVALEFWGHVGRQALLISESLQSRDQFYPDPVLAQKIADAAQAVRRARTACGTHSLVCLDCSQTLAETK